MAPIQRYAELVEQFQWHARRIHTFGVHAHVGIRDGSKAIPIVNAPAGYPQHFLALTASSPFWSGHDTGLASRRAVTFGGQLSLGPPKPLADWSEFEDYMDTLLRAGTTRGELAGCEFAGVIDMLVTELAEDRSGSPGEAAYAGT